MKRKEIENNAGETIQELKQSQKSLKKEVTKATHEFLCYRAVMQSILLSVVLALSANASTIEAETAAWHTQRKARLLAEDGWLTLVGLYWVEKTHTAGSSPDRDFRFPDSVPAHLGTFRREANAVVFSPEKGVDVRKDGKPFLGGVLASDVKGKPDTLMVGTVRFYIIQRGDKLGVRVKDSEAVARKNFTDIERYPAQSLWRLEATFRPHAQPKKLSVPNVLGTVEPMDSPGILQFTIDGKTMELTPVLEEGASDMFIIFADETNKTETYGAGRFLYVPLAQDGKVTVDFNRALNPPCAFTRFATCPLPPKENRLKVRIEAGEKRYRKTDH